MQSYYYRYIEDEFNASIFEIGSAEDRIDEVNCRKVAHNKLTMSLLRILTENLPQYFVQVELMNTLAEFKCKDSSSLEFVQISIVLGILNLTFSFIMSVYRFCTWRSTMLDDVGYYVNPIVNERK